MSQIYLGADDAHEQRMKAAGGVDIDRLHVLAQRAAWGILMGERVGVDVDQVADVFKPLAATPADDPSSLQPLAATTFQKRIDLDPPIHSPSRGWAETLTDHVAGHPLRLDRERGRGERAHLLVCEARAPRAMRIRRDRFRPPKAATRLLSAANSCFPHPLRTKKPPQT